jgi:diguanylate cyclase (GGDEF)-like protein
MPIYGLSSPIALDLTTLFVVAVCVSGLLGILLLFVWTQDRVRALAWWGTAYLVGGVSIILWGVESYISPPLPTGVANATLFIACGMIWNAARLFQGRPVLWGWMVTGATIWFAACLIPDFIASTMARIALSSIIVSTYTFLTARELWRERRRTLLRRWPAILVPLLHGMVFLCPIPLASILPTENGMVVLTSGWVAVFMLEVTLYVVGTAFILLVLSKERAVRIHRDAASTDDLTGLLNRRGFVTAARKLIERSEKKGESVSVLVFDLDRFKSVNDRFGHVTGDETLRLFASVAGTTMRASDIVGRLGGEEFVAILPASADIAVIAAQRVRRSFETVGATVNGHPVGATVSIGAASGEPGADIMALIEAADKALYEAKKNGRNQVSLSKEFPLASRGPRPTQGDATPATEPALAS